MPRRLRVLLLALALAATQAATSTGAASAGGRLAPSFRVAGRGRDVRIRRLFRPGRKPLGDEALMRQPQLVSKKNYEDVKAYVEAVLVKYPPDRYFYVGVGRTPTPIIAMLKNLGPDLAVNFPSSAMKGDGRSYFKTFEANYREHIDALIPRSVREGDRKILLMDYSSGPSLRGLHGVLEAYREAGGTLPEIEMVSVGGNPSGHDIGSIALGSGNHYWDDREAVAEYEGETGDKGHKIHSEGGGLSSLSRNPKHAEHRRALYQRMMRDAELDQFLEQNFPGLLSTASRP